MDWLPGQPNHFWIPPALFLYSLLLWRILRSSARVRAAWGFLGLWVAVLTASYLPPSWIPSEAALTFIAHAFVDLAAVHLLAVTIFYGLLRRVRIKRFLVEAIIFAAYAVILANLLRQLGVNITGIFATSAVAAAVVGFALQDMLSNIAGGIALELGGGIKVGDFIKCGEFAGWVEGVSLRQTVIKTGDGDLVLLPNSQLYRSPVKIWAPVHRHHVLFVMPHEVNSQELIDTVEFALRASPIPGVASDPPPACVVQEVDADCVRYAAVIWLTRPGRSGSETSAVLTRIGFALQRAGIPFGNFSHTVDLKTEKAPTRESVSPVDLLRRSPILRLLDDTDLFEVGARLHRLSFAPGEFIIRQGDAGGSMYFIGKGKVRVMYRSANGAEREVSAMNAGEFFGEAALLTGEPRNASVQAVSRVDCYELDKEGLQDIVRRRPDFVEDVSSVMAQRSTELEILRDKLDEETALLRIAEAQKLLRNRIRSFFGWTSDLRLDMDLGGAIQAAAAAVEPELLTAPAREAFPQTEPFEAAPMESKIATTESKPAVIDNKAAHTEDKVAHTESQAAFKPEPSTGQVELARARAALLLKARRFAEARKALEEADALEAAAAKRGRSTSPVQQEKRAASNGTGRLWVRDGPVPVAGTVDKAIAIVHRYSRIAAGAGLVPGTLLTFTAILAVQVTMVWKLARCFGQREGVDRIRGSIMSLLGAALPTTIGHGAALAVTAIPAIIAGSVLYFLITPVLAYALTQAIGNTFVMHFESGGTLLSFNAATFREYFLREFEEAGANLKAA